MDIGEIIGFFGTFVLGGGLTALFTVRFTRKKAAVEVKVDEIKAIHDTVEMVYQPIITQQNERIHQLEQEVKNLNEQLISERAEHQRELDIMNKRILAITSALGMRAKTQIRDKKGRYKKADSDED